MKVSDYFQASAALPQEKTSQVSTELEAGHIGGEQIPRWEQRFSQF
jgi:hypothetical protein